MLLVRIRGFGKPDGNHTETVTKLEGKYYMFHPGILTATWIYGVLNVSWMAGRGPSCRTGHVSKSEPKKDSFDFSGLGSQGSDT